MCYSAGHDNKGAKRTYAAGRNMAAGRAGGTRGYRDRVEAELQGGINHANPEETVGIDRGLKAAREGRFATDEESRICVCQAPAGMKVVYTDEALHNLEEILRYIESNYPTVSTAFEKRYASHRGDAESDDRQQHEPRGLSRRHAGAQRRACRTDPDD